eukprot:4231228-Prymnesium_polylepis.1
MISFSGFSAFPSGPMLCRARKAARSAARKGERPAPWERARPRRSPLKARARRTPCRSRRRTPSARASPRCPAPPPPAPASAPSLAPATP